MEYMDYYIFHLTFSFPPIWVTTTNKIYKLETKKKTVREEYNKNTIMDMNTPLLHPPSPLPISLATKQHEKKEGYSYVRLQM